MKKQRKKLRDWKIIKVWKVKAKTALQALEKTKKQKHNRVHIIELNHREVKNERTQ